jgi:hypothetical protein
MHSPKRPFSAEGIQYVDPKALGRRIAIPFCPGAKYIRRMSRSHALTYALGLSVLCSAAAGCGSSEEDIGGGAGKAGSAAAGGAAPTAGAGGAAIAGSSTGSGGAGSPAGGKSGTSGDNAGGTSGGGGGGGGGGAGESCETAPPDACPMPSGIQIGCNKRFALGINYAWRNFGADFGGLATWSISGVAAAPTDYASDLAAMKSNGAAVIRWWVFPDLRGDGVQFDAGGDPTGLSPAALADMAKALELAAQAGVYLVPTIFSFDAFRPEHVVENVTVRGMTALVTTPERRNKLIGNVVRPLAQAAAASPHASRLLGWDVINEPEWAIEATGQNAQDFTPNEELDLVSLADMKALINESAAALKQETPAAFTSVGWAAAKWAWAFADVPLDVNQPHIYGWVNQYWPYTSTPAQLGYPERPTIMGEFFLQAMPFSDSNANDTFAAILESWWSNGYAGAWPWQHYDQMANLPLLKAFADAKGCPAQP